MTVASSIAKAGPFACNGVTTVYNFSIKMLDATHVKVIRTDFSTGLYIDNILVKDTDFTVSLNADQDASPGGSITTLTAYDSDNTISIARDVPVTQGTSIPNLGGFYPKVIEAALDKVTMLIQQVQTDVSRSLLLSYGDDATTIPELLATISGLLDDANNYVTQAAAYAAAASSDADDAAAALASVTALLADTTDFATLDGFETLSNKTITAPVVTGYTETQNTSNSGSSSTISLTTGTVKNITLTANCTFTFPSPASGKSFLLILHQDGTGSRTVTWPASPTLLWPDDQEPVLSTTASHTDIFSFVSDGTSWFGVAAGQNYGA